MSQPNYFPSRHRTVLANDWRLAIKAICIVGLLACCSTLGAMYFEALALPAAVMLAILIVVTWSNVWGLYDDWRYVRIIPYFEHKVGNVDSYIAGYALARYCVKLDEVAIENGQAPLSEFGFNDDLCGEDLIWHSPARGLQTVTALLNTVEAQPHDFEDHEGVLSDLAQLSHSLQRADEKGVHFCLLLVHGNSTSGHEWDIRKGTAF